MLGNAGTPSEPMHTHTHTPPDSVPTELWGWAGWGADPTGPGQSVLSPAAPAGASASHALPAAQPVLSP